MSISAALSNAITGLSAASRSAELVSSNVANAMTEGYARREIQLSASSANGVGDGVRVDGIRRVVDEVLLRDRRLADAAAGRATEIASHAAQVTDIFGLPDDPTSLSGRVIALETALIDAASRPDSDARLAALLDAARGLVQGINDASDGLQQTRMDADAAISAEVTRLNETLVRIADINALILRSRAAGEEVPGLLDQRQALVDEVAGIVPLRQFPREDGTIALYTTGGALLLDLKPGTFEFTPTAPITPDMTLASGALSGLVLNGEVLATQGDHAPIAGGRLAALFDIRDVRAVEAQGALDDLARDLVERFEDPAVDPTLLPGQAGLFTDGGAPLDPGDLVGLSARLALNAAVQPSEGGALWRLRDGIAAAAPGPPGDSALLARLSDALDAPRALSGAAGGVARSLAGQIADTISRFGQAGRAAEQALAYETARRDSLRETELSNGVDTDQEMQKLLLIEQAYGANARVIQTADRLIQTLLGI